MANIANLLLLPVKSKFKTKILHQGFIITSIIQCKIAKLVFNLKLLDNLNNLYCNILTCMLLGKLR